MIVKTKMKVKTTYSVMTKVIVNERVSCIFSPCRGSYSPASGTFDPRAGLSVTDCSLSILPTLDCHPCNRWQIWSLRFYSFIVTPKFVITPYFAHSQWDTWKWQQILHLSDKFTDRACGSYISLLFCTFAATFRYPILSVFLTHMVKQSLAGISVRPLQQCSTAER